MKKGIYSIVIILSCALFASAQERIPVKSLAEHEAHESIIHFRFDRPQFDLTYLDNEQTIQEIDHLIQEIGYAAVDSVVIISQSSPEGVYEHNISLARKRAVSIAFFMRERYPALSSQIYSTHEGEAWGRLRTFIETDPHLTTAEKERAFRVIDADINVGTKKWRMERLPFYRYLQQKYYKELRYSAICMIYYSAKIPALPELELPEIEEPEITDPGTGIYQLEIAPIVINPIRYRRGKLIEEAPAPVVPLETPTTPLAPDNRTPVVAFRTNLLIPGLNAGVDVPIGKHWSVGANYYFPWFWPKKDNKNCYELLGWELEGRYWFGKNRKNPQRLLGHSIGLNTYGGYYDLEKNYRGMQGEFVSVGIGYRYALALGKKRWGHLEFAITLGYLYSEGRTYDVKSEGGPLFGDDNLVKFNFFGPTKAEITLNIPIYQKKEGRR